MLCADPPTGFVWVALQGAELYDDTIIFISARLSLRGGSLCPLHGADRGGRKGFVMPVSIEFLNELVDRFAKATAANLQTKGRRGSLVHLGPDDADEVYLAGDLHGNRINFNKLVKEADLEGNPRRHLVLQEVVHGGTPYPNGGCMSHMLLEEVAKLKVRYPDRFHFLLCNHELAESMKHQISKAGVSQNFQFASGLEYAYGPASTRIAQGYHEFIRSAPLGIRLKNGVFISHSLPDRRHLKTFDPKVYSRTLSNEDVLPGGSAYSVVWGRDYDEEHVKKFLKIVQSEVLLTGHEPTPDGYKVPNAHQIIFDCSGSQCWVCRVPLDKKLTAQDVAANLKRLE